MKRTVLMLGTALSLAAPAAAQQAARQPQASAAQQAARQPQASAAQQTARQPQASAATTSPLPNTQALFDRWVREGRAPGMVGAFGFHDLPTVFVSAGRIGTAANAAPAGPDSLWRIYSMTKPVTGMAAMILVEEGKIGLDDPVSKYFPGFAHMRVLTSPDTSLASVPAQRPITIRMLLTHTSGLGYSINAKGPLLKEYERLGLVPAALNPQVEREARATRPATLAGFAERLATVPLPYQPGTRWHYSMGLDLMGAVIEKASGMPFDAFVKARLLDPLRMTSTGWSVAPQDIPRFADNVLVTPQATLPVDPAARSVFLQSPSFPYGGAGLVSSARDYDRFLHMLQNGGTLDGVRVMKPETAALGMSNLLPAGVAFTGFVPGTMTGMGYGAGGYVFTADRIGGPAKGTYGWNGAANTTAWVDPARQARGTVMVNVFPPDALPIAKDVGAALMQDVARYRR